MEKTQNEKELIKEILQKFLQTNISKQELINLIHEINKDELPLELLKIKKLSNLEAIVKYLRENLHLSYREISEKLNRNSKTLAVTYKKAKEKMTEQIIIQEKTTIPYIAFKNNLSILESVTIYLLNQGMKQIQIAKIIEKNPRTIWTTIQRANEKIKNSTE